MVKEIKECHKICKETDTKVLHLFSFSTKELNFRDYNWDVELENSYIKMNYALTITDIVNHINYIEYPSKIIFRLTNER